MDPSIYGHIYGRSYHREPFSVNTHPTVDSMVQFYHLLFLLTLSLVAAHWVGRNLSRRMRSVKNCHFIFIINY